MRFGSSVLVAVLTAAGTLSSTTIAFHVIQPQKQLFVPTSKSEISDTTSSRLILPSQQQQQQQQKLLQMVAGGAEKAYGDEYYEGMYHSIFSCRPFPFDAFLTFRNDHPLYRKALDF
jgi:hypothetical protein